MRSLVIICALFLTGCDSDRIAKLEKQNRELAAKLDETVKAVSLDTQEKCAKRAAIAFKQSGFHNGGKDFAGYTNHYNQKLGKCFIEMSNTETLANGISSFKGISDAFEGKDYGEYMWINNQGKKYWEVKPFECKVMLLSGEEKHCDSEEEFDKLLKVYME